MVMGLFSFLTGSKKEDEPTSAPTAEPTPPPSSSQADGWANDPTPFKAPPAWNTEALTAPRPDSSSGEKPQMGEIDPAVTAELQPKVVEQLKTVFDPEIPVDIYELGLVYDIAADAARHVLVKMTLTSPACPSAQQIPSEARYKIKALPDVTDAWVEIVWDPPWDKDRMSEAAKLQLGFL